MKVGDLVKTKVPGFGTGDTPKLGTIVDTRHFLHHGETGMVYVFHEDGTFREWYPWQLEVVSSEKV